MAQKAPGKHYRTGMSLVEFMDKFPTDRIAEEWFEQNRWPDGVHCPDCGSDHIHTRAEEKRRNQPHRCRDCKKDFSAKTGSIMHASNVGYRVWAMAIYLLTTNLKGVSSMKLRRDLKVTQKTAWMLAHKIREAFDDDVPNLFGGPVESDEAYIGGKRKNWSKSKRKAVTARGTHGKTAVVGVKDRPSNQVKAKVVPNTNLPTLQKFVAPHIAPGATLYTDEASVYRGYPFKHEAVKHSALEYVRGEAHTNGIESFWAMLKRGYYGTYHKMSVKHLERYVDEFAGRHNSRPKDTIDQMASIVRNMDGKRLTYKALVS